MSGGRMEFGETAEETLKREIFEELNIEIKSFKVIDTWNYMHNDKCQITGLYTLVRC
ncbi:NUDIX domain-containing protein [Flavobacterium sp. LB3P122]|uniref:NUDIX domain-containing protein n=1 Tax=Flavobacterium algoriphilum TaxID=3398738 RepID=UPI003A89AA2B